MPVILSRITLPLDLIVLMDILNARGYESYLVGGCVRDILLGKTPHDYDVTTQATPEQIKELFTKTIDTGIQHGSVTVVMSSSQYEVTTMRTDGTYSDSRHPDSVVFTSDIEKDLSRRDFTMNAIAAKVGSGDKDAVNLSLVDPFNGRRDIKRKAIVCVGDAKTRFQEDPLRLLRAIRFSVQLKFHVGIETETLINQMAPSLVNISAERIQDELRKIFLAGESNLHMLYCTLHAYRPVFCQIIPELKSCIDFNQHSSYHAYTVCDHIFKAVGKLCNAASYESEFAATAHAHWFELCMTMLLHDIGKPQCFTQDENGIGHFYGHAKVSADMADSILRRLKFSNAERERIVTLIEYHDYQFEPSARCANRLIAKLGAENAQLLTIVRFADLYAHGVDYSQFGEMNPLRKAQVTYLYLAAAVFEDRKFSLKDLAISGVDLIHCGYTPGPDFKRCLNYLLDEVINGNLSNTRTTLISAAKDYMEEHHA